MTSLPGSATPVEYPWALLLPFLHAPHKGWSPQGGLPGMPLRPLAVPLSPHSGIRRSSCQGLEQVLSLVSGMAAS